MILWTWIVAILDMPTQSWFSPFAHSMAYRIHWKILQNQEVRDDFRWRDLRGLGKLLAYGFTNRFQHARSTRWKRRHGYRRSSLPSR